ncbi:hypothetical protein ETD86_32065 [Nonomuraea turkmeniaca]|uniref:DUF1440 domain-containing protein n=1 Tax=Nonomuraea turkmeniaca TaxID=103838 RepID=A0A5S4F8C8_9ACTN|nr:DUF6789 family protein [Nonomuraea turkmeniaca]TMR12748.1 hypothetical protein ETD86_32065 [Nonomuraea turkmeniaca]
MMRNLMYGAVSGAVATAAMSVVMVAGQRAGFMADQPPKRIARAALPGHKHRRKPGEGVLGAVAHVGFGSASGGLFGLMTRGRHTPLPLGIAYALTIWIGSYAGWVPRLGILPSIPRDQPGRQTVMAAGHVVYGVTLACAMNRLTSGRQGSRDTGV